MKRPQYVFRPQLSIPDHRKAWTYLQQMPANQRKDFLVRAILAEEQRDTFKQMLRDVIREELTHGGVIQGAEFSIRLPVPAPSFWRRYRRATKRWALNSPTLTSSLVPSV